MNDCNRFLQNISFNRRVSSAKGKKIVNVSQVPKSDKTGFTCYDLFQLNTNYGLTISIQIVYDVVNEGYPI